MYFISGTIYFDILYTKFTFQTYNEQKNMYKIYLSYKVIKEIKHKFIIQNTQDKIRKVENRTLKTLK